MKVVMPILLPMMGTMEFICGACVGAFIATCLLVTAYIIDMRKNDK